MLTFKTILKNKNNKNNKNNRMDTPIYFFTLFVALLMAMNLTLAAVPNSKKSGVIVVKVVNVKGKKGNLLINLFSSSDGFPNVPKKAMQQLNTKVKNSTVIAKFKPLPQGTYAVAVCHDENSNNVCDTNFLGIPREGIGVSNSPKARMGPPKFAAAKFDLNAARKQLEIKLTY